MPVQKLSPVNGLILKVEFLSSFNKDVQKKAENPLINL